VKAGIFHFLNQIRDAANAIAMREYAGVFHGMVKSSA
jgi:hypothetical protein